MIALAFHLAVIVGLPASPGPPRPQLAAARPAIERAAKAVSGTVGAAAMIIENGDLVMVGGAQRFPMQSVYKLPIAWAVLREIDAGKLALNRVVHLRAADMVTGVHSPIREQNPRGTDLTVRELLRAAVVESDGTASDALLTFAPLASVSRLVHTLGADSMMLTTTERQMAADPMAQYRSWSSPRAALSLLRSLQLGRGISAPSRALLMGWLTESTTGAKRIRGLLPRSTVVADKTGTDGTTKRLTRATNDIGIVQLPDGRHLAVAVFIRDSRASESAREAAIAKIARAAWDAATTRKRRR